MRTILIGTVKKRFPAIHFGSAGEQVSKRRNGSRCLGVLVSLDAYVRKTLKLVKQVD